ncbi:MAG TPA: portal protein, partial [Xanthobacteraceae bacterium]|nr:portal protein [Xanthobacteraceae bacterium]
VAYDTATECAVSSGVGYFRIGLDHTHEDTFDLDIGIDRVLNPFSIYGDPCATAADSSDWMSAFVVDRMTKNAFAAQYKGAEPVDWEQEGYAAVGAPWFDDDGVMVAEWWRREEYVKTLVLLSDGTVSDAARMQAMADVLTAQGITVQAERQARCFRVRQYILSGAEVLEERAWPGRYIPIIPVYGDEVDIEGKRHFRSLIRDAKDAQRMFNYWRTTSTELIALAPKTPFIGPKGAFVTDAAKWASANTQSHAYIEYDGPAPPQRQPFVGVPAGALQEALNAADDMKAVMGLYDASLGARSNETSGRAILARQREGDVSTFHFLDNMTRAIRHAGRVIIDLIPHVYDKPRIVRVLGEDGRPDARPINQPVPLTDRHGQPVVDAAGAAMTRVFDLTAGKYDVTVSSGPSFTTRREEAAAQMTEMVRAFPQVAPLIGDIIAKNLDWPGADEIAKRLQAALPPNAQGDGGIPPRVQQLIQQGQQKLQELAAENAQLKADRTLEAQKLELDRYKAVTERMKVVGETAASSPAPAFNSPDRPSLASSSRSNR